MTLVIIRFLQFSTIITVKIKQKNTDSGIPQAKQLLKQDWGDGIWHMLIF